jgi:hypothetical protein
VALSQRLAVLDAALSDEGLERSRSVNGRGADLIARQHVVARRATVAEAVDTAKEHSDTALRDRHDGIKQERKDVRARLRQLQGAT